MGHETVWWTVGIKSWIRLLVIPFFGNLPRSVLFYKATIVQKCLLSIYRSRLIGTWSIDEVKIDSEFDIRDFRIIICRE